MHVRTTKIVSKLHLEWKVFFFSSKTLESQYFKNLTNCLRRGGLAGCEATYINREKKVFFLNFFFSRNRFGSIRFYSIVGYLLPNPFLYVKIVQFQAIQFNIKYNLNVKDSFISNILHHSHIHEYAKCIWDVYNIYHIEHRNLEIRKTRNDFFVQIRNFLLLLSLKVFRPKEREVQSFYSGFFISPHPNTCGTRHKDLREQAKTNRLPPRQVLSQLTDFFKISQNPPRASGAWGSFLLASFRFPSGLLWHLWVTRPLHLRVREHLC